MIWLNDENIYVFDFEEYAWLINNINLLNLMRLVSMYRHLYDIYNLIVLDNNKYSLWTYIDLV